MSKKITIDEIKELIKTNRLDVFYNSRYWRNFSKKEIKAQNYECQLCKRRGKVSRAKILHHVKQLKKFPELAYSRFYVDSAGNTQRQLLAVCFSCHEAEHERVFKGNQRQAKGYRNEEKF